MAETKGTKNFVSILLLFLILSTVIVYFLTFRQGHDWGDDFSIYIMQTKSIVEGKSSTVTPELFSSPGIAPWGFPLLLTPVYYFWGADIIIMKIYISLFFFLSLIIIFLLFKEKLEQSLSLIIVAIFAFNPYIFLFKDNILTDIPFFFFCLFIILLIQKIIIEQKIYLSKRTSLSIIGVSIYFVYFIRYPGIILLLTLLICQLYVYYKKTSSIKFFSKSELIEESIPYLSFLICWVVAASLFSTSSVVSITQDIFSKMTMSVLLTHLQYFLVLPAEFFDIYWGDINPYRYQMFAVTIPFVIMGIVKNIKKDYLFLIFSFIYFFFFVLFGDTGGLRYLFPILPFYWYFFFIGLITISRGIPKIKVISTNISLAHIIGIGVIIGSCYGIVFLCNSYALLDKTTIMGGPFDKPSSEMFAYISNNTMSNDTVIFFKPRVMTLMTGRKSSSSGNDYSSIIRSNATVYVYYKPWAQSNFSVVKNNITSFNLKFRNDDFYVFNIIRNQTVPETQNAEDGNIRFFVDGTRLTENENANTLSITGWAFSLGKNSTETKESLLFNSTNATYIFDTIAIQRPDVVFAFKELHQDVEWSGFQAEIPVNQIKSGIYSLGIMIQSNNESLKTMTNIKIIIP